MKFLKVETLSSDADMQVVTLNRPDVKNAFNPEMISEITETFKKFNQDKSLKAIFLKGDGTAFCAGADLNWMKEMAQYNYEQNVADSKKLWDMFESIMLCEAPLIGLAQGAVFGGALGLLACCDYVVAEEKTKFCFSEVKLGLAPAVISSFILRKVADTFVRPLMLSAEVFNSQRAQAIGLIHEVGAIDLEACAKKFSENGTEAMRETKKLLNQISQANWSEQMALTTKVISERRVSFEGQTRLKNFLSKIN